MNKSRWDEILAVSARLFREKGYRATTMEDIAAELNVTKPALYYYIKTKHDLLYAICESAIGRLVEGVRKIMEEPTGVEDKLRKLIFWHVNMFSGHGDMIIVYLGEESELPEDKRTFIRSLSREFETMYRQLLDQGIKEDKFRKMDVPMAVRAISGMCNWLVDWYRPDGQFSADEIAEIFYDLILKGCLKR
jgi:TetR/AcrR family transcriptional regulator, cholesterol catabolism regulator